MTDVNAILQKLRDNKKAVKPVVADDATSIITRRKHVKDCTTRPLGKFVGHCPHCMIFVGSSEVANADVNHNGDEMPTMRCSRCGEILPWSDQLPKDVDKTALVIWRRHDRWGNSSIPAPAPVKKPCTYYLPSYEPA